jgi:DNA-binding NtrC family response regulator
MVASNYDILLIDDDGLLRSALTIALRHRGYSVLAVSDGREGLDATTRHAFRLVITDLLMPDVDGLELIMRSAALRAKTPILAMSGGGRIGQQDTLLLSASRLGCHRTLEKPFDMDQLFEVIEAMLQTGPMSGATHREHGQS